MCDVAILNPTVDMTVSMVDGFYNPHSWSNSPSSHYGGSSIASPPCAQSPNSSIQHSPVMPIVHSPVGCGSPAHSPIMQQGSPIHVSVKREGGFSCSSLTALLTKPGPPELVPVFGAAESKSVMIVLFIIQFVCCTILWSPGSLCIGSCL